MAGAGARISFVKIIAFGAIGITKLMITGGAPGGTPAERSQGAGRGRGNGSASKRRPGMPSDMAGAGARISFVKIIAFGAIGITKLMITGGAPGGTPARHSQVEGSGARQGR